MSARPTAQQLRGGTSRRRPTARQSTARRRSLRRRRFAIVLVALAAAVAGAVMLAPQLHRAAEEITLPLRHEDIIRQQAAEKDIPAELIAAVIYAESRFRDQESHAGARGLMQVTPATAELIEEESGGSTFEADDLSDPDINIRYGTFYLRYLLDKFDQNLVAALAAYNAGETNVASWGGSDLNEDGIQFEETRDYVEKVLDKREEYREHYGDELGLE